jgi:hypothetical protein
MDGLYMPDGRQLALIDREWILDDLPHLGNPDNNSDPTYSLGSAAAAAAEAIATHSTGDSTDRSATNIGTGNIPTQTSTNHTGNHQQSRDTNQHPSLLYNPDEFEVDLALISEIVDETQNKWSDLGLNRLLTAFAHTSYSTKK